MEYPDTRKVDQVDEFPGLAVPHPYRWLEHDVRQDPQVQAWVDAQQRLSDQYLKALPGWQALYERFEDVWDTERYGVPEKAGGRYFYAYNDGLMNQDQVLTQASLDGAPTVLFDPNTWSEDGTDALAAFYPDPQGRYVAYMLQQAGSDWRTARVRDLETSADLSDRLQWLKFTGLSWAPDGSGFYYTRYPEPTGDKFHGLTNHNAVYFHAIGTDQSADELVYIDPAHPDWRYVTSVTDDGAYLVIIVTLGTANRFQVLTRPIGDTGAPEFLVRGFEHDYTPIGHVNGELLFYTDLEAPRGRVIALDPRHGDAAVDHAREVLPEGPHALDQVMLAGNRLVAHYLVDANSQVEVFGLDGASQGTLDLPGLGSVDGLSGRQDEAELFYSYSSLNHAPTIQRVDVSRGESEVFRRVDVDLALDEIELEQVFFRSADGTRVPMFIAYKRGLKPDGSHPTILYGYGGFKISMIPAFSMTRAVWIEQGGVFAIANLRGGGEYGEAWHAAGTRLDKQNVFDDFIGAAEFLIDKRYTSSEHLGIMGGSNGGLLVGAVLNQRPDLFGAALPVVGVMDMLRFHHFTAGAFWVDDYGSADDPAEFEALYAYSPYHNVRSGAYPPVLIGTADTDDRVVPGHSFKYAARLQELQQGTAPVLLRVESKAGHGLGKPTDKIIEEYTDYWAFMRYHLGRQAGEQHGRD